jgi:hypothetical protein
VCPLSLCQQPLATSAHLAFLPPLPLLTKEGTLLADPCCPNTPHDFPINKKQALIFAIVVPGKGPGVVRQDPHHPMAPDTKFPASAESAINSRKRKILSVRVKNCESEPRPRINHSLSAGEKYRNRLIFPISKITDCMEIRLFDHRQDHACPACLIIGWLQMNTRPNAQHALSPMDRLQLENRSHLPIFFLNRAFFGQFQIATVRLQRPLV